MKESLALAVREIHGFTQHTTANLFEAVLDCGEAQEPTAEA